MTIMSNYVIVGGDLVSCDSLMHYGVKGMRWGHRKTQKIVDKRDRARSEQDKWEAKYEQAMAKGRKRRS
jgi:hypothetical protein